MDQRRLPPAALRALYGALIGAACIIGAFFPPALLVAPGLLAFLAVGWGAGTLAAGAAALALTGYFLSGVTGMLHMLALCLPAALALVFAFMRRKPYRDAMVVAAALVFAALYAIVCLPGVLEGRGPAAGLLDTLELLRQGMMSEAVAGTPTGELVGAMFDALAKTLPDVLIAALALSGMAGAGTSLLLARALSRRAGAKLRPMARLARWRLGKSFTAGAAILLVGALAINLMRFSYAASVMYVVQAMVVMPLALQGIALLEYLAGKSRSAGGFRTAYILVFILLLPLSVVLTAGIGVLEQLFQLRRRMDDAGGGRAA